MISRKIVRDVATIGIGMLALWIVVQVVFGTSSPFYVVSSGSMVPELMVFDMLVVQGNIPFSDIDVGDIIVFDRPSDHDRVIVHRVDTILVDDPKTLRTKGDANPNSIPGTDYPITEEEYLGKVVYVVPQIGYVTRILTPPINYIIIVIIIGVMIANHFINKKKERIDPFKKRDNSKDEI